MLKYQLLALDVDNTLTDQAQTVPARNVEAIRRAREAGIHVTLATGRNHLGSGGIIRALDLSGPMICYGGATIVEAGTGDVIFASEISNELVQESLSEAAALGVHAQIYQGNTIVCAANDEYTRRYTGKLGLPAVIDTKIREKVWHNVPKVLWIVEPNKADALIQKMRAHFAGRLKISGSSPGFIEFNSLGIDKGTGLARLAAHMGIERSAVAAVGDNSLDAEMIEWAGLGAAVRDAKPEILAIADMVLPSCADCGVAWLIDEVLLKEI